MTTVTKTTTKPLTRVRQTELSRYKKLEKEAKKAKKAFEEIKEEIIRCMQGGMSIEKGELDAELKLTESRRPSWKDEGINVVDKLSGPGKGAKWAEKVLSKTEPTAGVKLIVE